MTDTPKLRDCFPARNSYNVHTLRGMYLLEQSVQRDGWIGAITVADDGEVIAGSACLELAVDSLGLDSSPLIVPSDGTAPVIVVRTDIPDATCEQAQRLALASNRIQAKNLAWDGNLLARTSVNIKRLYFFPNELPRT